MAALDPRSKLIALITSTFVLMGLGRWWSLGAALVILILATLLIRLGRSWFGLLKGLSFAVVSFFVIAWVAFDVTTATVAGLRLLALSTVFFLFFQTTSPESLSNSLIKSGVPYSFAFVFTASMQFIPVLVRRATSIRDAQRSRGIPVGSGWGMVQHLPALAGPLLIQAFKLADELAEAMEARGFGAPGRGFRHVPRFKGLDWLVVTLSAATLVTYFLFR